MLPAFNRELWSTRSYTFPWASLPTPAPQPVLTEQKHSIRSKKKGVKRKPWTDQNTCLLVRFFRKTHFIEIPFFPTLHLITPLLQSTRTKWDTQEEAGSGGLRTHWVNELCEGLTDNTRSCLFPKPGTREWELHPKQGAAGMHAAVLSYRQRQLRVTGQNYR